MTHKILFDCDNTMGLQEKDVDDGLAFFYLLGRDDIQLEGITSVFGNGSLEQVKKATTQLLKELAINELPFYSGAEDKNDLNTAAAQFLVEQAQELAGEITLLATGPLTNLKAAYQLDNDFFTYFKEIIVMGGITEELSFNGQVIDELNFSCDPEATKLVLEAGVPVTVASGNLCLDAFFGPTEWERLTTEESSRYQYLADYITDWYQFGEELIGKPGFYMWDVVAALYITNPKLYTSQYYTLQSTTEDLTTGQLVLDKTKQAKKDKQGVISIPAGIKDGSKFKDLIFTAWDNF
ncbi:nucleoside hydrolase [Halanaerobaculum tunisiense]